MDTTVTEPAAADSAPVERTYDVYFTTGERKFYFHNSNYGLTLGADSLAWTFNGKHDGAPFENIVELHLQWGGSWQNPVHLAEIIFADRYKLIVVNGNGFGLPDDRQRSIYRDFVRDLLSRLAAHASSRSGAPIAFTGGYREGVYHLMIACAAFMILICIGVPFVALLLTGDVRPFLLLLFGALFIWKLVPMVTNNAPQRYDPRSPPDKLLG
jgi:hypothetical protein